MYGKHSPTRTSEHDSGWSIKSSSGGNNQMGEFMMEVRAESVEG